MSKPTHVFVSAAEGREVPIPTSEATAPGAQLLKCRHGRVYRLPWSTYTRRRINATDLYLTDSIGRRVANELEAAAPDLEGTDFELGPDGDVVRRGTSAETPGTPDELEAAPTAPVEKFDTTDTKPARSKRG